MSRHYYIKNSQGKVLDVEGNSTTPGTSVILWTRNSPPSSTDNQHWTFTTTGSGHESSPYLEIYSQQDVGHLRRLVLEVKDGNAREGTEIVTGIASPPTTTDKQLWFQVGQQIVSKLDQSLAIGWSSSNDKAILVSRGNPNSLWSLEIST